MRSEHRYDPTYNPNSYEPYDGPLTPIQVDMANRFYERIRHKDPIVQVRYLHRVQPQGLLDTLCDYMRNDQRKARHAATLRALNEHNVIWLNDDLRRQR